MNLIGLAWNPYQSGLAKLPTSYNWPWTWLTSKSVEGDSYRYFVKLATLNQLKVTMEMESFYYKKAGDGYIVKDTLEGKIGVN